MLPEDTKNNRLKCVCPKCPSYPHHCSGEVLFCANKKSKCEIEIKGCICNICPIFSQYNLTGFYYCDKEEVKDNIGRIRKERGNEDVKLYSEMIMIKEMAATGKSVIRSMGSLKKLPFSLDNLHFIPAQVHKIPLNSEEKVATKVVLGPRAKKPLFLNSPILISGMSYGAVSRNVRLIISQTAAKLGIGYNSGEGGILKEEFAVSRKYLIGQYATGRFGLNEDILKKVAAIEIRFGQGAYPGKGSYLPPNKLTPEVAEARGLKAGEAAYSPAHHHDMTSPETIKKKVQWLKSVSQGVPVGAKIGCGNIEKDIKIIVDAGFDFIALDGFGGGTGATDLYIRENVGLPIVVALPRANNYLLKLRVRNRISLIASGNLKTSADFAKCLALGADAVYIGTAALIAIGCEQYRLCHTGLCPTGVTTHNPVLVKQLDINAGVSRLENYLKTATQEIANLTRIVGKDNIALLSKDDLVSFNKDLAEITGVKWLAGY